MYSEAVPAHGTHMELTWNSHGTTARNDPAKTPKQPLKIAFQSLKNGRKSSLSVFPAVPQAAEHNKYFFRIEHFNQQKTLLFLIYSRANLQRHIKES
jgi:hypothetical protein